MVHNGTLMVTPGRTTQGASAYNSSGSALHSGGSGSRHGSANFESLEVTVIPVDE